MQRFTRLFTLLAFIATTLLQAQTTLLDETLLTQSSYNTFTPVSVAGNQGWTFSASYGAVCSGYSGGQSYANEDWLISAPINLTDTDNPQLSFSHARGSTSVMNVGVADGWYTAWATADYTGNPATTTWVEITGINQNITTAWQYIASGSVNIPEAAVSANTRIAFRYESATGQSATWEIKNVKVTGEPQASGNNASFKITNWNLEWLGCTGFGPEDETLQIQNVATAMALMNADIYCIQEVINTPSAPSITTLVNLLGSNEWGGTIIPVNTGDCNQRQGLIYKKSKVQLGTSVELSTGAYAQGGSYYYNWSSGRYPAVYNVNLISGSTSVPVTLVNIHAKAGSSDVADYQRRLGGAEALKTILDGAAYNTKNLILIGDYNDYLLGTTAEGACNCTISPFRNFVDDTANYTPLTQNIVGAYPSWNTNPIIENIIISNELVGNYIANSAAQETTVQSIDNYFNTTSDHLPVSARFQFATTATDAFAANAISLYPNPARTELHISSTSMAEGAIAEVYDLTGRKVLAQKTADNILNVSSLPSGLYIVKMGNASAKFVKE